MHYSLHHIVKPKKPQANSDCVYSTNYIENASGAITNFHHFAELILKDILKRQHALLSVDASDKTLLFYDLLRGKDVKEDDIQKMKQIEFSMALKRIRDLIKDNRLDD